MIYQTNKANGKTFIVVGYAVYTSPGNLFSTISELYTEDTKCLISDSHFVDEIIAYLEQADKSEVWGHVEHFRPLTHHEDYRVRALVALNGYHLDILCDDASVDVRECVARKIVNAYNDVSELKKIGLKRTSVNNIALSMVEDSMEVDTEDTTVCRIFAEADLDVQVELHSLLKHHQSDSVRSAVALATKDQNLLTELAFDLAWYVRNAVALNSNTPDAILSKLREDADILVRVSASR